MLRLDNAFIKPAETGPSFENFPPVQPLRTITDFTTPRSSQPMTAHDAPEAEQEPSEGSGVDDTPSGAKPQMIAVGRPQSSAPESSDDDSSSGSAVEPAILNHDLTPSAGGGLKGFAPDPRAADSDKDDTNTSAPIKVGRPVVEPNKPPMGPTRIATGRGTVVPKEAPDPTGLPDWMLKELAALDDPKVQGELLMLQVEIERLAAINEVLTQSLEIQKEAAKREERRDELLKAERKAQERVRDSRHQDAEMAARRAEGRYAQALQDYRADERKNA